jgi:hypothetical protein
MNETKIKSNGGEGIGMGWGKNVVSISSIHSVNSFEKIENQISSN